MTKNYEKLVYEAGASYTDDFGGTHNFRARFVIPAGIAPAAAAVTNIAGLTGANIVTATTPTTICPDAGFTPRRLKFIFASGGSFSIPVADRTALVATRDNVIAELTSVGAAYVPVCIQLLGEVQPDITDTFRPAGFTLTPGTGSAPTDGKGKQYFYHGTMAYLSDGIYGNTYYQSFKVASESPTNAAPALLAGALTANGNNVVPVSTSLKPCRGSNIRIPRRFMVTSLITNGAAPPATVLSSQRTEIPVANHLPTPINGLASYIATIASTQCLGYAGESNRRFHKV